MFFFLLIWHIHCDLINNYINNTGRNQVWCFFSIDLTYPFLNLWQYWLLCQYLRVISAGLKTGYHCICSSLAENVSSTCYLKAFLQKRVHIVLARSCWSLLHISTMGYINELLKSNFLWDTGFGCKCSQCIYCILNRCYGNSLLLNCKPFCRQISNLLIFYMLNLWAIAGCTLFFVFCNEIFGTKWCFLIIKFNCVCILLSKL